MTTVLAELKLRLEEIALTSQLQEMQEDITKVDLMLSEHGLEIIDDDVEAYAETLIVLAESEKGFSLGEKDFFGKVGKGIRTLAHHIGKTQGKIQGAKDRWSNFKKSVFHANRGGYERGHKSTARAGSSKPSSSPSRRRTEGRRLATRAPARTARSGRRSETARGRR